MKRSIKLTAVILCICMLLPTIAFAYPDRIIENDPINMPKATPDIDALIEDTGAWSNVAYLNDPTLGHFWATRPLTFEAEVYFAYDDSYLYFAADIHDNDADSGFVPTTGLDNVDADYGFNGDVMTLMLDALGVFEKNTSYQTTPWYHVGMQADGKVRVYRNNANSAEITNSCKTAGAITEDGWKFEIAIPWLTISGDVSSASSSKLSASLANLKAVGSVSRAACMYLDRYVVNGVTSTWGRFISVCDEAYDGTIGISAGGVNAKTYGLTLNHTNLVEHSFSDWKRVEPTCTADGYYIRTCGECGKVETTPIPATGHTEGEQVITDMTCTQDGKVETLCAVCKAVIKRSVYPAPGHDFGEWYNVSEATDTAHGLDRRDCKNCDHYEDRVIPSTSIPYISVDNYDISVTLADSIKDMRFALGSYSTPSEIKAAPGNVAIDNPTLLEGVTDGVYHYEMPTTGEYTFWVRMKDGREFFIPVEISNIRTYLTAYGVKITVNGLRPDVKDFFIAKGNYSSYSQIKSAGYIFNATAAKIAGRHDYTYTVYEDGTHTVLVRYNDGTEEALHIYLTVDKPVFTDNGLQVTVSNIPDVRMIRTAYGTWNTVKELKATDTLRNFSAKTAIKGKDPYTIQYRDEGAVTIIVEYNNGYVAVHHYDVAKKQPTVTANGPSVTFNGLDGLYVIRYAQGEYTTVNAIKNAPGSKYIRASEVKDDTVTVYGLEVGVTYTFCVQYADESYNYYTITGTEEPAIVINDERQLLADDYIINTEASTNTFFYGQPVKKEKVFTFNKGYESKDTVYHNITQLPDGSYRMYYKATGDIRRICYIESKDGINWTRPSNSNNLYNGSKSNIVTNSYLSPDNLFVFYDTNPNCPENQRWKGVYGQWGDGLFLEYSTNGDGKDFQFYPYEAKILSTPAETEGCYFDTLNTMYWDEAKGKYVAFVRGFHYNGDYNLTKEEVEAIGGANIVRDIRYSESVDCINWSVPVPLNYSNEADWQMYANAIIPYYRSESLYVGMPTRYQWLTDLPEVDIFMMASHDLLNWERSDAPFMTNNGGTWEYGDSGYPCIGFIETTNAYGIPELSFFMKEWDESADCTVLYRYTLRLDGFRGAFGYDQKLVTKTLVFEGSSFELNYACAVGGGMEITITDMAGNSISSGYITGDSVNATVSFDGNVADFAGKPVTITFDMDNASFYSFKFN